MLDPAGRVGVIGLGLIGGSLLRRLTGIGVAAAGWDTDPGTRAAAAGAGLTVLADVAEVVATSDTVFLAVPLPAVEPVFRDLAAAASPSGPVFSDLTSVKEPVRRLALRHGLSFVGGHPMAGAAESGFGASDAELLAGCAWVLALDEETDLTAWLGVAATVTGLGCRVVPCTSAVHDTAVARISHLPHLFAALLVAGAAQDPLALSLAAGSFRDATRVATTRPELTAAMCAGNAAAIAEELRRVAQQMASVGGLLGDPAGLTEWFAAARAVRQDWPPTATDTWLPAGADLRPRLLALGGAGGAVTRVAEDGVAACRPATSGD
ncbi:MAG: prephenate dehydrogenase/arogenate dehydrogenase family protein [bacterium]